MLRGSTVKNGNLGLWRDTNQAGLGLNADTHAKKRGEFAGLFRHGDNGGTLADADNAARLAVQADDIASAETEWIRRFSFGILRSEQTRLRGLGGTAGAVGLGSFAGDSVAVQRRVGEQVKSLWREPKLMLRDGQAASVAFHGGCSFSD